MILFKLILLQRRVICFGSPVRPICSLILGILSLHPEQLEQGLNQAACVRTSRPMSPMPDFGESATNNEELNEEYKNLNEIPFDRKISVTEADQSKLAEFEATEIRSTVTNATGVEKNNIPRDTSVDMLASNENEFVFRFVPFIIL